MHGCQKKRKKKEANDEVGNPASFLHPAFPSTSDSLAFWCFAFARQCCQIFRSDEKRSEREAFPFSPPLSIFLSFFLLSWKVSARCKVSRFYWSQSFAGSVRFVEFSKKLHSLLNHTVYADVKFVLYISYASCQRKGCKTSKIYF